MNNITNIQIRDPVINCLRIAYSTCHERTGSGSPKFTYIPIYRLKYSYIILIDKHKVYWQVSEHTVNRLIERSW